jgi:hypothetical protein
VLDEFGLHCFPSAVRSLAHDGNSSPSSNSNPPRSWLRQAAAIAYHVVADGGTCLDALEHSYRVLGLKDAAGRDEVFRDLLLARIIEPPGKVDSGPRAPRTRAWAGPAWSQCHVVRRDGLVPERHCSGGAVMRMLYGE